MSVCENKSFEGKQFLAIIYAQFIALVKRHWTSLQKVSYQQNSKLNESSFSVPIFDTWLNDSPQSV